MSFNEFSSVLIKSGLDEPQPNLQALLVLTKPDWVVLESPNDFQKSSINLVLWAAAGVLTRVDRVWMSRFPYQFPKCWINPKEL